MHRTVRRHLIRAAVAAATTVAGLAAAPAAHATFAGANGSIAFRNDVSDADFWLTGGTGVTTPGVSSPAHIAWSRSGTRVAFDGLALTGGTGHALFVENADGTGLSQVGRGDLLRYDPA